MQLMRRLHPWTTIQKGGGDVVWPIIGALFATTGLTQHTANTYCTLNIQKDTSTRQSRMNG